MKNGRSYNKMEMEKRNINFHSTWSKQCLNKMKLRPTFVHEQLKGSFIPDIKSIKGHFNEPETQETINFIFEKCYFLLVLLES